MIVNCNLTLYNKTNIRLWIDTDNINEIKIKRFLKALAASNNLNEQVMLVDKITQQRGYNEAGEATILYTFGEDVATVIKCNFRDGKFRRGRVIKTINLI